MFYIKCIFLCKISIINCMLVFCVFSGEIKKHAFKYNVSPSSLLVVSHVVSQITGSTPMNSEIACNGQVLYKNWYLHSPEDVLSSAANSIFHSLLGASRTKDFRIAPCVNPSWLHPHQPSQTSGRPHRSKGSGLVLLHSH